MYGKPLDYYLLPYKGGDTISPIGSAPELSFEEVLAQSYNLDNSGSLPPIEENPYRDIRPQLPERPLPARPLPQAQDPETMAMVSPPPRSQDEIPWQQKMKEHMASSGAAWSNVFQGLGRRGRNFRADPMAPYQAAAALRNQYLNEQKAAEELRKSRMPADPLKRLLDVASLEKRQTETELAKKRLEGSPVQEALEVARMQREQAEAELKARQVELVGTEEERKEELIKMINDAMKKEVASKAMSLNTLEGMASDIGLDPLKLRRAKAAGGGNVSGKNIAYSSEKAPQLAGAVARAAKSKSRFLSDRADQEAYEITMDSADLSAKQKREIIEQQGWDKEIERNQERLYRYADETLKKISAPENGVAKMFGAINELQRVLAKYPNVPGWNAISSTLNSMGKLGQWTVDLSNFSNPAQREIMEAIRKYNEAYRRIYSGAAIADHEKADFAGQLGAGAFSSPQAIRQGVTNAERVLRDGINNTFMTIDERVQSEYRERIKQFLPKQYNSAQEAWSDD